MKYAVNSKGMKRIDDYTVEVIKIPAMILMERAAYEAVALMKNRITKTDKILAVCGPGNNGGDGIAAGRILYLQGYQVAILFIGDEEKAGELLKLQLQMARNLGIYFENSNKLSEYNIIIDALFGIGLTRPVTGEYARVINAINENAEVVYSLDIPSGICADSGAVLGVAVKADYTVTFGYQKLGLLLYPGADYAGRITVADIGFPDSALGQAGTLYSYYEVGDLKRIPPRSNYSNKGTYGKILVIAGSKGMSGAAYLSAKAAYRMGAGLVKLLTSKDNRIILQTSLPEAIFAAYDEEETTEIEEARKQDLIRHLSWADVIVIGPGLGLNELSFELLQTVIKEAKVPVIIDADAITLLGRYLDERGGTSEERLQALSSILPENTILTPHLMEFSRLNGIPISEISNNLIDTVERCSYNNLIYVIKDARTIIARGDERYINISGNNGMATGGSGDVLTGIIAALIGQGMSPYEAACLGVYLHGLSADAAAEQKGQYSMMASDIIEFIYAMLK